MIIWGSKGCETEQEVGRFHCPQCDCEQPYKKVRVASFFTLYFIPLFETQHHGDYVQCQRCNGQFKPEVLNYKPPSQIERLLCSIRADLESGTPIPMVHTKLRNAGVEDDFAEKLVTIAAGDQQKTCPKCNLLFVQAVARCSVCGGASWITSEIGRKCQENQEERHLLRDTFR